ncbi:15960_t:CDS:1, partial [Cetraspora pellucida]
CVDYSGYNRKFYMSDFYLYDLNTLRHNVKSLKQGLFIHKSRSREPQKTSNAIAINKVIKNHTFYVRNGLKVSYSDRKCTPICALLNRTHYVSRHYRISSTKYPNLLFCKMTIRTFPINCLFMDGFKDTTLVVQISPQF